MSGSIFALLGALSFGFNAVTIRRAVAGLPDATVGVFITVFLSVPFFFIILLVLGRVHAIANFTVNEYLFLAVAGIIHYIIGRSFSYACTQLVGSNIRSVVTRSNLLIAVIFGIALFHEPVTAKLLLGVSLILLGLIVVSWQPVSGAKGDVNAQSIPLKGILLGLIGGVFWGISPILVKYGLRGGGDPIAGTFISYTAASLALCPILLIRSKRDALSLLDREAVLWFSGSGITSAVAQLCRYVALSLTHVSVVAPLFATNTFFVVVLSFIFNRKMEVFKPQVIIGMTAVFTGALLVF